MSDYGLLVESWPLVPGCDAGGIVVKAGNDAVSPLGKHFKEGDKVFGCTRLGSFGYSPWQEYVCFSTALLIGRREEKSADRDAQFLMDAAVTIPKPD